MKLASVDGLMRFQWFKEAFELPVLSVEEVDTQIAARPEDSKGYHSRNVSLQQVMTELDITDIKQPISSPSNSSELY
ncbi:MAG: hypothetical protein F6K14_13745 [Symploca sp. SIO2C1]|nr:hypothetical protein [Symploca sp. SIO2C1]